MLRRILICILLLSFLTAPAFAWKFVSMADSRGSTNGVNTAELTKIVNRVNAENVDLVIFQGDAVTGSSSDTTLSSQMDTWLAIMNTLNCPWYYCPGNHEIQTATAQEDVLRAKVNMPLNGPAGDLEMVYSFDHENAHFISLNSNHYNLAGHVQLSWLASDLAATTQPHIFVYAHEPAYPAGPHIGSSLDRYTTEREDFWRMMTNYGVRMYFCGHEHLYQRTLQNVIYQVINGTCGAPIYSGTPNTVDKYHYVVVSVDGNNVHCEAKDDNGVVFDIWDYTVNTSIPASCDAIKLLSDGAYAALNDKIVTCVRGSAIYVEDDDRSAAFRVVGAVTGISVKDRVNIRGWLQTNTAGEREINGSVYKLSSNNILPKPLGMSIKSLLGGSRGDNLGAHDGVGANTSSLLVRICGKVTSVGTGANAGMFYLDDGSGVEDGTVWDGTPNKGVRVVWSGSVIQDEIQAVNGICSSFKNGTQVCRLVYCTDKVSLNSFTAYNDLVYSASSGHPVLQPNVTTYSIGSGSPGPTSGTLKDFTTGADTGVTVTLVEWGGVHWQPSSSTGGTDCSAGTDAYNTFNANTASLAGVVYYGATGWYVDATFTGLDPARTYEFATSANRDSSTYGDRITKFTISGADSFTNSSTPGTTIGDAGASTSFCTGYNRDNGYVARWTGISPGADGSFSVRAQAGSAQNSAYAFSVFKLVQSP